MPGLYSGLFMSFRNAILVLATKRFVVPATFIAIVSAVVLHTALAGGIFTQLYRSLAEIGAALDGGAVMIGSYAFGIAFLDLVLFIFMICHMCVFGVCSKSYSSGAFMTSLPGTIA